MELDRNQIHQAFDEMSRTGSHFASRLAELYFRADGENTRKIIATWPELIQEFYERSQE